MLFIQFIFIKLHTLNMRKVSIELLEKLIQEVEATSAASAAAVESPAQKREVNKFKELARNAIATVIRLFQKMIGKRTEQIEPVIRELSEHIVSGWDTLKVLRDKAKKILESITKLKEAIATPKPATTNPETDATPRGIPTPTEEQALKLAELEQELLLTQAQQDSTKQTLRTKSKLWDALAVNSGQFGRSIAAEPVVVSATKAMKEVVKELA
jgi:hypothetical protein